MECKNQGNNVCELAYCECDKKLFMELKYELNSVRVSGGECLDDPGCKNGGQ